jgi:SAM-dependent methyltransferase
LRDGYSERYQSSAKAETYESREYAKGGHGEIIWRVESILLEKGIARFLPSHREANALDFACGTGRITTFLRPLVRAMTGLDISEKMLEIARPKDSEVRWLHCDILREGNLVSADHDLITCFRFVLMAEPALREACLKALSEKLRSPESLFVIGVHGNPHSYRGLANLRNRILGRRTLPGVSIAQMRSLARRVGLRVDGISGAGYLPHALHRILPGSLVYSLERWLADWPFFRRFGSNLIFFCRKA